MTPFERLVHAVELDVTGEEGNPHYETAVEQARLYVESTLKALARVQAVRDVAGETLERHWETSLGWLTDYETGQEIRDTPDPASAVGEVLDALAGLVVPPVGARR